MAADSAMKRFCGNAFAATLPFRSSSTSAVALVYIGRHNRAVHHLAHDSEQCIVSGVYEYSAWCDMSNNTKTSRKRTTRISASKMRKSTRPEITVSSLDVYRLYNLLESPTANDFAGKDELITELSRARLLAPTEIPPTVVTMNSTVRFSIAPSRKTLELTLVYPEDADATKSAISILSPVGSALLGLSPGDSIEWPDTEGGVLRIKVKEITYQPERAGKFDV